MLIYIRWSMRLLVLFIGLASAQEDSLQSALDAFDRRQRDLRPGHKNNFAKGGLGKYYLPEDRDDIGFLKQDDRFDMSDYLKEDEYNNQKDYKKHITSPFRERMDRDKEREKDGLSEMLMNRLDNNYGDNEDYMDLLQLYYDHRKGKYPDFIDNSDKIQSGEMKKRVFPSDYYGSLGSLGYNSVGLKKKSRYFDSDGPNESLYLLNYTPRDELFERLSDDDDDNQSPDNYNLNQQHLGSDKRDKPYFDSYSIKKRFPVAKRSNPPTYQAESKRTLKRGPRNLVPTDPKVAKDLSSVFGTVKSSPASDVKKNNKSVKPRKAEHLEIMKNKTDADHKKNEKHSENKEVVPNSSKIQQLQIKKKSIDWSDYFGYDRKKKNGGDIDNEWLMERYHKAIAMATKRNVEYPLQTFHNHDKPGDHLIALEKKNDANDEEAKLIQMDLKLKNIEDSIVDEALKYTGAHEGATDSKEIQDIKDKVISRLAAAYSLEKMRQALGEYKMSIAKQRKQMQDSKKLDDDDSFFEEKRVSVPRKQAIDEEREKTPEGDNNIKCSHGDEDCEEQTYKPSSDIVEEQSHWLRGDCLPIQRACNEVAEVLGHNGRTLEPACNLHQICLLCGENSWFAPTRQCNVLFLAKADELCDGDTECNKTATHSVRYLLDIYRSLRTEHAQECDLQCPDNRR